MKRILTPHWIVHPHFIARDDYECSECGARRKRITPACPNCGTPLTGRRTQDTRDWEAEEEEDWLMDDDE